MAAYAALVSLMSIIDQIEHHPRPPISLDKPQVESLTGKVTFLQEFLEGCSQQHVGDSNRADPMEMRIADAAYAAEDVIESHIVDRIIAGSTISRYRRRIIDWFVKSIPSEEINSGEESSSSQEISPVDLCQGLQKVIEEMESIKKEVMEMKEKMGVQLQLPRNSISAGSLRSSFTEQNTTMVGCDDVLLEIMDKLTDERQLARQIIPIVGMGGIGGLVIS